MSRDIQPDPTAVGRALPPPFARLPRPGTLFRDRSRRFETLAEGSELAPYLRFLGALAAAQDEILPGLPAVALPSPERRALARGHGMPPLDRAAAKGDEALVATLHRLFDAARAIEKPPAAAQALDAVAKASPEALSIVAADVLADSIPVESLAGHAYVAAGLQVHFTRLAAGLDASELEPVGDGVCPACGGPILASMVVGWPGAENARYCMCALCATLWNHVRVKCTICSSTEGIGYREIEGSSGTVKAECCDRCASYVKIMDQREDSAVEPLADDVASLGLDILMREQPYKRASFNPFLLGA